MVNVFVFVFVISAVILHPSALEVTVFPRSGVFLFEVCNNDSYVVRDVTWA